MDEVFKEIRKRKALAEKLAAEEKQRQRVPHLPKSLCRCINFCFGRIRIF